MTAGPVTESWWTPSQVQLVADRDRQWRLVEFESADMVRRPTPGGWAGKRMTPDDRLDLTAERVPDGWDHEHCSLCGAKISRRGDDKPVGYTDGKDWVCTSCFAKYISPRIAVR